jgi:hypothetical protein
MILLMYLLFPRIESAGKNKPLVIWQKGIQTPSNYFTTSAFQILWKLHDVKSWD